MFNSCNSVGEVYVVCLFFLQLNALFDTVNHYRNSTETMSILKAASKANGCQITKMLKLIIIKANKILKETMVRVVSSH